MSIFSDSHLYLDDQTQRDLEVLSGPSGKPGLFDWVDSTGTRLGSCALKERFRHPSNDVDEILSIQHTLAFLRKSQVAIPVDDELLGTVDKYLKSRIEVSPWAGVINRFAAMASAIKYRNNYSELSIGTTATARLVLRARDYCKLVLSYGPADQLASFLLGALAIAEELIVLGACEEESHAFWHVLQRDSIFRLRGIDKATQLVNMFAEMDALQSMARFGEGPSYVVPELSKDEFVFEAEELFHPMIENPVSNSLSLDMAGNVVYLTGPNMAGKTTFLKTVGIALFLAQLGMRVPATRLVLRPVDVLFAGINTADDLSAGVSYYLAEVRRVKQAAMCLSVGSRSLMLFDEVFKGTNVVDATDATKLVVESCVRIKSSMFIFSSHLAELAESLAESGVQQRSFAGKIEAGIPIYSYQLHKGASDQRMGLLLLKQEGVLELLGEASLRMEWMMRPNRILHP